MMRWRSLFVIAAAVLALGACGGDSGSGAEMQLVFTPNQATGAGAYQLNCGAGGNQVLDESQALVETDADVLCDHARSDEVIELFTVGPDPLLACTQQFFGDEQVQVDGQLDGGLVTWTARRTNGCTEAAWQTFGPLLPPVAE